MAAAQIHKMKILGLYREMLREAQKFTGYNYRTYAVRRIRDAFREHKAETNPELIEEYIKKAKDNLIIIRRQATISQLYREPKLVIESDPVKES